MNLEQVKSWRQALLAAMQDGGGSCEGAELEDLVTRGLQTVAGMPPGERRAVMSLMAAILPESALQAGADGLLEPAVPTDEETQDSDVTNFPAAEADGALPASVPGGSCCGGTGGASAAGAGGAAAAASKSEDKKEAARLAAVRAAAERAVAGAVIYRPMVGPGLVLVFTPVGFSFITTRGEAELARVFRHDSSSDFFAHVRPTLVLKCEEAVCVASSTERGSYAGGQTGHLLAHVCRGRRACTAGWACRRPAAAAAAARHIHGEFGSPGRARRRRRGPPTGRRAWQEGEG